MHSISTLPFHPTANEEFNRPALKKTSVAPFFGLQHFNKETAADVKKVYARTVADTLNNWRDIISSRLKVSELHSSDEAYGSDKKLVTTYYDLLDTTETYVEEFRRQKEQKSSHIMILTDADARIQAIASLTIKDNSERVVVETLISAPWNVPMNSENNKEHKHLCIKGAGTTMMRQIYELALVSGKKKLELRPLESARSFYVDTLKMIPDGQSIAVHFVVTPDNVPEKLQVSAGNLLRNM